MKNKIPQNKIHPLVRGLFSVFVLFLTRGLKRGLLVLCLTFTANAAFNVYEFDDNQKEVRFQNLIEDLRCPKCQNNNLADSNAPLATDIKNYVYQSMKTGKSDDEITDFLVSRYGLFIIYDPKIIWIWLLPLLVVLSGLFWALKSIKSRQKIATPADLPSMASLIADYERQQKQPQKNVDNTSNVREEHC